ncbi:MAG: flagellar motor protein PomA, partial [Thermodesulfobacteriota bacterium]
MDIATVIGLIAGILLILTAIFIGGSIILFINPPSVLIVGGGTLATVLIRFGLSDVINAFKVAKKAFTVRLSLPSEIIREIVNLATIARKNGLIVLEQQPIEDPFLKKAIMYCVDGHEAEFIDEVLKKEVNLTV